MHIGNYIALAHHSEQELTKAFRQVAEHHKDEPDIEQICQLLATWSEKHVNELKTFIERYSEENSNEPERLTQSLFEEPRSGGGALLRDLHDLWLMANEAELCWIVLSQAAQGLHDKKLEAACARFRDDTKRQLAFLLTRIKVAAPQTLIAAD
ncbi:molybdopterin oxidoreductase [Spirosoma taeanense]|uniref:Molybdopterin oxidoreductase n=1 Tax=Spirosoma taeanense TaxID=2735870 RepID=A0A6M5Y8J4_9BACT|nr:molybdopterin oxidoreductase [Spirosoma taeanense]QJW89503.1 molybdopterin oxidoreductase [Spirosoma taeanense]